MRLFVDDRMSEKSKAGSVALNDTQQESSAIFFRSRVFDAVLACDSKELLLEGFIYGDRFEFAVRSNSSPKYPYYETNLYFGMDEGPARRFSSGAQTIAINLKCISQCAKEADIDINQIKFRLRDLLREFLVVAKKEGDEVQGYIKHVQSELENATVTVQESHHTALGGLRRDVLSGDLSLEDYHIEIDGK